MFQSFSNYRLLATLFLLFSCQSIPSDAQSPAIRNESAPNQQSHWVDSVYNALGENERIGQFFMIAAYSAGKDMNQAAVEQLLKKNQIGGVIFMQGTPEDQARLTNAYQKMSKVPLMIGMDAEWGLGMRLTGVQNFPRQMMIGATRDTALMYEMGQKVAEQCNRMGVHINFAPDIDVNNNPKNPVINFRSFGADKIWVSKLGIAYAKGLQDNGVLACAKHFPGHGDVSVDSHHDLPVIAKTRQELKDLELYPFKALIAAGVKSVMIAHLEVPQIEPEKNRPSTLSYNIVTRLLKEEYQFDGLIFTDALNMKGVTKYYPDGETDLQAFLAGNDVLLFSQNVPLAISKIKKAIEEKKITSKEVEQRVKKILNAKYELGLHTPKPIAAQNATKDLNKDIAQIKQKMANASVTLIKDNNKVINTITKDKKVAYLAVNGQNASFATGLKKAFPQLQIITSVTQTDNFDYVIVGVHKIGLYPGKGNSYGISTVAQSQLNELAKRSNTLIIHFGNAYSLKYSCNAKSLMVTYEEDEYTADAVIKVMNGQLKAKGFMPVSACN